MIRPKPLEIDVDDKDSVERLARALYFLWDHVQDREGYEEHADRWREDARGLLYWLTEDSSAGGGLPWSGPENRVYVDDLPTTRIGDLPDSPDGAESAGP